MPRFRATSTRARITNSAKAAFSRAKRNLEARGAIRENLVFPYELTSEELADYAVNATSSAVTREHRKVLLPIVIARSEIAEFVYAHFGLQCILRRYSSVD